MTSGHGGESDFVTLNSNIPCCVLVNTDSTDTGVVYCSKQTLTFADNKFILENKIKQIRKISSQKSKKHNTSFLENECVALLEIWKHIELFGGFITFDQ